MEFRVLDRNFQLVYVLDAYESMIWVDRLYEPGSFELYTPVTREIIDYCRPDNYVVNPESEHTMIIEDISIESDAESGDHIKVVGRSLESILDRRIVWKQTTIEGRMQEGIKKLLNKNIIAPQKADGGSDRRIYNFEFEESDNEFIKAIKMSNQYAGDNLLAVINSLCVSNKVGFKITLTDKNYFRFKLYVGSNRSYNQTSLPFVVFSQEYDNLINSNYVESYSDYKNVALVAGQGEGAARRTSVVGTSTGIFRKEIFVDAGDLQASEVGGGKKYKDALNQRGKDELYEHKIKKEFDGKFDTSTLYKYGVDFFLGDTVQVENEYGISSPALISEYTWSCNADGEEIYPTFQSIEDGIVADIGGGEDVTEYFDYFEQTKKLSTSKDTVFIFESALITDISFVDIGCSIYGFFAKSAEFTEGTNGKNKLTVTFPKYTSADKLTVRVYLK